MPDEEEDSKLPWYKTTAFWVAVVTAAGAIIAAAVTGVFGLLGDNGTNGGGGDAGDGGGAVPCVVSGVLYEETSNRVFPGVDVGYVPQGSAFDDEEAFEFLNTTGQDGSFAFDCDATSAGSVIALRQPGWGGCIDVTEYRIPQAGQHPAVNLFVDDTVMTTLGDLWGIPKNDNCQFAGG